MAVISTKELMETYFSQKDNEFAKKNRSHIDRKEVYEYEKKIGKQLVDMNADELFDMISTFKSEKSVTDSGFSIAYSTYVQTISHFRALFDYYIDNHELIKNPFYDKRLKGMAAAKRIAQIREPFTMDTFNKAINMVRAEYSEDRAKYVECIMLLFFNGFSKAGEIADLKENMINFRTKEVWLPGRTLKLSDRCFELLTYVHTMEKMETNRLSYIMKAWNDRYFKYPIRAKEEPSFNERSRAKVEMIITQKISEDVRKKFGIEINFRMIYYLGFYEYMISVCGKERAKELLVSIRNSSDTEELMRLASNYGVVFDNITILKRNMHFLIEE